jgi:hypothetical protein
MREPKLIHNFVGSPLLLTRQLKRTEASCVHEAVLYSCGRIINMKVNASLFVMILY